MPQVRERPVEVEPLEDEPEAAEPEPCRPLWGTRATLWQWLVVLGVSAVAVALFSRALHADIAVRGAKAIPGWVWDLYDWKTWPLSRFR